MAYAITASKWLEDKRYIEAVLDSAADLAALGDGYAPDSRAIVAEGGAAYMTDASGHWQELGSPGGGGGSSVTVEPLTVTQNGTTTAPSGKAYSPVTVNVPGVTGLTSISVYDANNPPTATLMSIAYGHVKGVVVLVAVNQDGVKYSFFERISDGQNGKVIFKRESGETITLDVLNRTIEGATSVTVYRATLVYPD